MASEVTHEALMVDEMGGPSAVNKPEPASQVVARLINRCVSGDGAAFDDIVRLHERQVVTTAWRLLGNREDARDAAQEAFLRAYRHLHTFDTNNSFPAWMYRVVVNVCRDMWRKRQRQPSIEGLDPDDEAQSEATMSDRPNAEAAAIRSEQEEFIARALEMLPAKQRAAVVLRDLEGLSTEEVARVLGSSQVTVRTQICAARARLKLFHQRWVERGSKGTSK